MRSQLIDFCHTLHHSKAVSLNLKKGSELNLEKLGVVLFVKYLRQFDVVRNHLASSLKELLMAASSSIEVSSEIAADTPGFNKFETLNSIIQKIDSLLKHSIDNLDVKEKNRDHDELKENVLVSIIQSLDDEIIYLQDSDENNIDLKIDALKTVKRVIVNQIGKDDREQFNNRKIAVSS